jgi:S-(hydroxymethyl)glutathione dehydrogenase/alcohol dehydrogenase
MNFVWAVSPFNFRLSPWRNFFIFHLGKTNNSETEQRATSAMSSAEAPSVITCKAMVQWENGGDLIEETVRVQPPKQGQVRVKILASGVCHTDWSEPRSFPSSVTPSGSDKAGFPVILGHEGGGIVESVGPGVTSVQVGDHVIPLYIPECRECENCLSQKTNLCSRTDDTQGLGLLPDGSTPFSVDKGGKEIQILMFMGCSTFSEYTVLPEYSLAKIPKTAPLEKVCLLGCGITTGYGAVHNTMKVEAGSTAAVFGLGGVGLAVVMALKEAGCAKIIGVDTNPVKEPLARKFGITHFVNPKLIAPEDTLEGTVWQTNGGGLDYTFECIGNVKVMRSAVECLHEGWGKACIIGVAPSGQEVSIRPFQLVVGKTWTGSAFGGTRGRTQLPKYVQAYMEHRAPFVDEFVSATLPYTEVNEAFHLMHEGKTLRSVITFPHAGDAQVEAHRKEHHPKSALVFLHGLGDEPASWEGSMQWLASKLSPNTQVVCPAAPKLPITKNNGEELTAWFDVFQPWPRTPAFRDDAAGLARSVATIHQIVDDLVAKGVPSDRIVLGGFSQGAVTATLATYTYSRGRLAGCLNLSGWVPNRELFVSGESLSAENKGTPLFWGHGANDEIVSIENQSVGKELLAARGTPVEAKEYAGLGHDSNEAEFADILHFLQHRLSGLKPFPTA